MSLATRCTACGTVFRVVQDQLKVSEGWVRCGRCDAVFNALEGLFDLDRDAAPPWEGDAKAARAGSASQDAQQGPGAEIAGPSSAVAAPSAGSNDDPVPSSSFPSTA